MKTQEQGRMAKTKEEVEEWINRMDVSLAIFFKLCTTDSRRMPEWEEDERTSDYARQRAELYQAKVQIREAGEPTSSNAHTCAHRVQARFGCRVLCPSRYLFPHG